MKSSLIAIWLLLSCILIMQLIRIGQIIIDINDYKEMIIYAKLGDERTLFWKKQYNLIDSSINSNDSLNARKMIKIYQKSIDSISIKIDSIDKIWDKKNNQK